MSVKGLPGFLRRTLRHDFEEEDEEDRLSASENTTNNLENDEQSPANHDGHQSQSSVGNSSIMFAQQEKDIGEEELPGGDDDKDDNDDDIDDDDDEVNDKVSSNDNQKLGGNNSKQVKIATTESSEQKSNDKGWKSPPRNRIERKVSYRESQFEKIISADVVNISELRKLGWNGIPPQHRGIAWKLLLGYVPSNASRRQYTLERKRAEYKDAIAQHYDIDDNSRTVQEQETLRQVLVDVPRTAPEIPLFRNEKIRRSLARLLYIWAMRHPASSYVQGINDLATPLLAVFLSDYYNDEDVLDGNIMVLLPDEQLQQVEADCYWCLSNILAGIQDHYTADQPGVQRMVMRLEELVNRIDSDLCEHLRNVGIQFIQFAFKWMNCLLLREFNLRCVIRLWDTYISEDGFEDFHVYVCAAFLCQFSTQLQSMEFDELFGFMQQIPTGDWTDTEIEMLLSQAFVLSTLFGGSDAHLANNQQSLR